MTKKKENPQTAGRPTKYKPEYCEAIVESLRQGNSLLQFAVSIGVVKSTLQEWKAEHPEFSAAYTRAVAVGEAHWEGRLQDMMCDSKVNAPLVKLYFANRFGWHDKQAVDHTSTDGSMSPTRIEIVPAGK